MRFPHLLKFSTYRAEPIMAALAAVAIGMFVGTWVIGPAITGTSTSAPVPADRERTTFADMVARPDPPPYRAATPAFEMAAPNYAAAAKEKALAEVGSAPADPDFTPEAPAPSRTSSRNSRAFDRHQIY
ncbi:MAG: hypothetical protein WCG92_13440 [Hyphomicrobiales bacterium]|nr:hypothetical protein [Alphaproteobacteria bacterium]